jgi:hypothetical protein
VGVLIQSCPQTLRFATQDAQQCWVWLDATEGGASCRLLGRVSTRWVGPGLTSYNPLTALLTHVPNALLLQLTVLVVNLTRSVPLTSH